MEFKSQEKWRVQKNFGLSDKELKTIIKNVGRRHPLERWVINRIANNGEKVTYFKMEFVDWLENVYLKDGNNFYLDLEIDFFKKHISRLEKELNISPREVQYKDMSLNEMKGYFGISDNAAKLAFKRMNKKTNNKYRYIKDGKAMITNEGIRWITENYFRRAYLKDLEMYKLELQKYKVGMSGKTI